jgi:hypothetical protein
MRPSANDVARQPGGRWHNIRTDCGGKGGVMANFIAWPLNQRRAVASNRWRRGRRRRRGFCYNSNGSADGEKFL